jgi:hypothetical protein
MTKRTAREQINPAVFRDIELPDADEDQESFWLDTRRASEAEIARRQILVPQARLIDKIGERIAIRVSYTGSRRTNSVV